MSSSSEKTSYNLRRLIQTKIGDLNYRISDDQLHPNRLRGLKDRMIDGFADIDVLGQNRFRAVITGAHFNEALRRDFFFGANRIKKLNEAAHNLNEAKAAAAWVLTTCYYSAFFAGLELLRTTGTFVSYFDSSEINRVRTNATTINGPTEIGTYEGRATLNHLTGEIKIEFTKTGAGHHQFVWTKLTPLVEQAVNMGGASNGAFIANLTAIFGDAWPSPSDTRNLWNYRDAGFFADRGEKLGVEFRKLEKNRSTALNWADNKKIISNEPNHASSVALVAALILNVFDGISEKVLSPAQLHWAK